jgi:hypothetical protein
MRHTQEKLLRRLVTPRWRIILKWFQDMSVCGLDSSVSEVVAPVNMTMHLWVPVRASVS